MTESDAKDLGGRVRELRTQAGWTQDRLAAEAGISKSFMSEIEQGESHPRGPILVKLAKALGASLDYLLTGSEPEAPPHRSLEIPAELAALAARRRLPFPHVQLLLRFSNLLEAHRRDGPKGRLSEREWESYYDAVLKQLESGRP